VVQVKGVCQQPCFRNYTMCPATIVNVLSFGTASSNGTSRKTSNKVRFRNFPDCAARIAQLFRRIARLGLRNFARAVSQVCTTLLAQLLLTDCASFFAQFRPPACATLQLQFTQAILTLPKLKLTPAVHKGAMISKLPPHINRTRGVHKGKMISKVLR
jgi:hypothetical protein